MNKTTRRRSTPGRQPERPESVVPATLHRVHWFNHRRMLEPIGCIPPAEAEAIYWRQLVEKDKLAA